MKVRIKDIILEKWISIFFCFAAMMFLAFYLYYTGYEIQKIIPMTILLLAICIVYFSINIYKIKRDLENLVYMFEKLEKPYYIGDSIKSSNKIKEQIYTAIIRKSCKAMLETISEYEIANNDYRDFIEQWVHSIKTPVSVVQLICTNNPTDINLKIQSEIQRIENEIERILFFSKSQDFHNDYILKSFPLKKAINEAIIANKSLLIENKAKIEIKDCQRTILSDSKWLQFIFTQLLTNSIKYKKNDNLCINISSEEKNEYIYIYYSDNGIGIPSDEVKRIFDKGFTGTNGRKASKSSGFGLYLCNVLCAKLGIKMSCKSSVGKCTIFTLKLNSVSKKF